MAGPHSGGFPPRSSRSGAAAAGTREQLARPVTVMLSLADWLALAGWASAHVTDCTPAIIEASLSEVARQVMDS